MHKEDRLRQEAIDTSTKISNLGFQLKEEKERVEVKLEALKEQLSEALADHALGLVLAEKVQNIKKAISDAQTFLEDYPLIDQGLDVKAYRLQSQLRTAARLTEKRQKYQNLKIELEKSDTHDPSRIERLRNLATELGEENCAQFLAELERENS